MWLAGSLCLCLNLVTASSIGLLLHLSGLLWASAGGAAERGIRKEHSADPICADHIPVASCNRPQQTVVVTICVLKVLTICSRNSFPYTYFIFNLDPFQILGEANTCLFSKKNVWHFHTKYMAKRRNSKFSAKNKFCPCVFIWYCAKQSTVLIHLIVNWDLKSSVRISALKPSWILNLESWIKFNFASSPI